MNLSASSPATARLAPTASHYRWLAGALLVLAIYGSFIPLAFEPVPIDHALTVFRQMPVADASELNARGDWAISVALFAALSFLFMAAWCVDRPFSASLMPALLVVMFCAALSVVIEFCQIYFPPRTVCLNDIVLETAGGLAGTLLWTMAGQRSTLQIRKVLAEPDIRTLASYLLPCYVALLLTVQLMPFDFVVTPRELKIKLDQGRIWWMPFQAMPGDGTMTWLGKAATTIVCFLPLGFLRALTTKSPRSLGCNWRSPLFFGLAVASLVELLQLFVYSRYFDATDIITATLGIVAGWAAGGAFEDSRQRWQNDSVDRQGGMLWHAALPLLFVLWLVAVAYFNWQPFDFTTSPAKFAEDAEDLPRHGLRRFSYMPLVEYYWNTKYHVLDQLLKKTTAFLPLGVLAALVLCPKYQPGNSLAAVMGALVVGLVLEVGRYFLPGRVPGTTDIILGCIGTWFGFRICQHLRAILWADRILFAYMRIRRA